MIQESGLFWDFLPQGSSKRVKNIKHETLNIENE
jgi:hypothetical protein